MIVSTTKKISQNLRQVDCVRQADGASRGLPGKLSPPLQAGDGSLDVLDPKLSLLHMRSLEEVVLLLVCGDLEDQLNGASLVIHFLYIFYLLRFSLR